jgi:hypothetical protein
MSYALAHKSNKSKTDDSNEKNMVSAKSTSSFSSSSSQHPINNLEVDSHDSIIHLQQSVDNQATQNLIHSSNEIKGFDFSKIRIFQPKLKISQPGDAYEQEADKVAEHVMGMPISDSAVPMTAVNEQEVDRKCSVCEKKKEEKENNLNISRKLSSTSSSSFEATDEAANKIKDMLSDPGSPLDSSTRHFFETRLGHDFSDVRVHADGQAARAAQVTEARAFTVGRDIVFASGEYQPSTQAGRHLIAHELIHVVQQTGSKLGPSSVSPTMLQRQPTTQMEVSAEAPPAPLREARPPNVLKIVMSCVDKRMRIETATENYVYELIECSIPLGSYNTQVVVEGKDFSLDFPIEAGLEKGVRKPFMVYRVKPGQENPATLLSKQKRVQVDIVERVPVAEAAPPKPERPDKPSPASCVIRLGEDRVLVPRDSLKRNLFKPITIEPTEIWSHKIPLGSFGWVDVAANASANLTGELSANYGPGLLTDICLTHLIKSDSSSAPIEHPFLGPGSQADVTTLIIGGRARFSLPARAAIRFAGRGRLRIYGDYLSVIEVAAAEGVLSADAEASLAGNIDASVEVIAKGTRSEATLKTPIFDLAEVTITKDTIDAVDLAAEIGLRGRAGFRLRVDLSAGFDIAGYNLWRQTWNLIRHDSGVSWSGGLKYSPNPGIHWDLGTLGVENEPDQASIGEVLETSGTHEDEAEVEKEDIIKAILDETSAEVTTPDGLSEATALPFTWYKPDDLYPDELAIPNADDPKMIRRFDRPTIVRYSDASGRPQTDEMGIEDWPVHDTNTFMFLPYTSRRTPEQRRFNRVLDRLGYNRSGFDAEHVWDVKLRGLSFDRFTNLWPASNQEQQLAGVLHDQQISNYRSTIVGNINGRWFRITRVRYPL